MTASRAWWRLAGVGAFVTRAASWEAELSGVDAPDAPTEAPAAQTPRTTSVSSRRGVRRKGWAVFDHLRDPVLVERVRLGVGGRGRNTAFPQP